MRSLHGLFNRPAEANAASGTEETGIGEPPNYGLDPAALPEVWIAGHSDRAIRMAAEWGTACFSTAWAMTTSSGTSAMPGADGFMLAATYTPGCFEEFVDLVVPELQRRGRLRTRYQGSTLRENLLEN